MRFRADACIGVFLKSSAASADISNVISLKKYIESNSEELLRSALASYRTALGAMGDCGVEACPTTGHQMRQSLLNLEQALTSELTAQRIDETGRKVQEELRQWGQSAAEFYREKTGELKEIMLILARTGEAMGERDQRYATQLRDFTTRLGAISTLQDLSQIRGSLATSANDLKACAEKMIQEGQATAARLKEDAGKFQARLDEAERAASTDSLTGLVSRRRVEAAIETRISLGRSFSIFLLDLNGFKRVNDAYGHPTGDEVLKQFAAEMKSAFRTTDVVGRWGGDEFVVVLDAGMEQAGPYADRIRKWVFGEYTVAVHGAPQKVQVEAAMSLATWKEGETMAELIERADAAMYEEKRRQAVPPPKTAG